MEAARNYTLLGTVEINMEKLSRFATALDCTTGHQWAEERTFLLVASFAHVAPDPCD